MRAETSGSVPCFVSTRYQGSKAKSSAWIVDHLRDLNCTTVLDAFGGTAAVSWHMKLAGMQVTYNDVLECNRQTGMALIQNDSVFPDPEVYGSIGEKRPDVEYDDFIQHTFGGVYYKDEENAWLDTAVQNAHTEADAIARSLLLFALFQACLVKRPYNLFHRANLNMRTRDVKRSFGNKTTWERPFEHYIDRYSAEAGAAVFRGERRCSATCMDVMEIQPGFDLVYLDPPYVPANGPGTDYVDFYHFLEGMSRYAEWPGLVDTGSKRKHIPSAANISAWTDRRLIDNSLNALFEIHRDSVIALSYRNDGCPDVDDLKGIYNKHGRSVRVHSRPSSPYALSKKSDSREILMTG